MTIHQCEHKHRLMILQLYAMSLHAYRYPSIEHVKLLLNTIFLDFSSALLTQLMEESYFVTHKIVKVHPISYLKPHVNYS